LEYNSTFRYLPADFSGFLMGPLALGSFDGDVSRTELQVLADPTLAVNLQAIAF
jgi:hypothetical protein